jgi:superfamily II DNA or RNA helicase
MNSKHQIRGVLQAPPGVGKTFMAIKLTSMFRANSLIVVPNEVLQDQWVDAIIQFTDLTEDDIGIIQGSDISKAELQMAGSQKKITIVKIQSLYSQIKRNPLYKLQQLYKHIDMVIYDECHNSGAATSYAKTSSLFMTPNIIGLSATPYRVGLNDYLLKTAIGETIYKVTHNNLTPDVEIHQVFVPFTENDSKRVRQVQGDYNMQLGIFGACMKNKIEYFKYLSDVVNWNHSQGHNIVILFPTIALMENLLQEIEIRHPKIFPKTLLLKGKTKQDAMEMVKEERKILMQEYKIFKEEKDQRVKTKEIKRKDYQIIIKERRAEIDKQIEYLKEHALDIYKARVQESEIIVSNYNLLSAGFDKSSLSNIIFGGAPRIGKISVIQSIGRITRMHEGKMKPLAQYFIPSPFFIINKSTGIILNRNIKVQYEDAKFRYIGFPKEEI